MTSNVCLFYSQCSDRHDVFGDVKKFLKTLTRQQYIEQLRQLNSDPPLYEYIWGPRAHAEVKKGDVLQFVCKVWANSNVRQLNNSSF